MIVYYTYFALCAALAVPLYLLKPSRLARAGYLALLFLYMFALASFRYNIGSDYYSYYYIYEKLTALPRLEIFRMGHAAITEYTGFYLEWGFLLLCEGSICLGLDIFGFYALVSALCLLPAAFLLYKNTPNAFLSAVLYMALFCFASTIDFVRQNLALGITLLGYPLLKRRDWRGVAGYLGVILCAVLVHQSMAVLLVALLVTRIPIKRWTLAAYAVLGAVCFFFSGPIMRFALQQLPAWLGLELRFAGYLKMLETMRGLRIDLSSLPILALIAWLVCYKQIKRLYPDDADVLTHLMILCCLFWLLAAHHEILARFTIHFTPYFALSIPMLVESFRPKGKAWYGAALGVALAVSTGYFLYGSHTGITMRGHVGMYVTFPYESFVPWINELPFIP